MEIEIDGCVSNAQHAPGEHASLIDWSIDDRWAIGARSHRSHRSHRSRRSHRSHRSHQEPGQKNAKKCPSKKNGCKMSGYIPNQKLFLKTSHPHILAKGFQAPGEIRATWSSCLRDFPLERLALLHATSDAASATAGRPRSLGGDQQCHHGDVADTQKRLEFDLNCSYFGLLCVERMIEDTQRRTGERPDTTTKADRWFETN